MLACIVRTMTKKLLNDGQKSAPRFHLNSHLRKNMNKIILALIALALSGCQQLAWLTPPQSAATVKSIERLEGKTFRIELQGSATTTNINAWEREIKIMCGNWLTPHKFSLDLEEVSENSVWFVCKPLHVPAPRSVE